MDVPVDWQEVIDRPVAVLDPVDVVPCWTKDDVLNPAPEQSACLA